MLARQQHLPARLGSGLHAGPLLPCGLAPSYVIAAGVGHNTPRKQQVRCRRAALDQEGAAGSAAACAVPVSAPSQHCRNVMLP
jgi:hypothetical protein